MLVHFPGLEEERWEHMEKWLDIVEGPQAANWNLPLQETQYPTEINRFWTELREARKVMGFAEWYVTNNENATSHLDEAMERLHDVMLFETDDVDAVVDATQKLKEKLKEAVEITPS